MTTDETPRTGTGIDRRSALKKAAVAGTIAWTAPTILSESAQAVELIGPCTAKCAPNPTINVNANTGLVCNTNGAKWASVTFSVAGLVCPCGTAPNASVIAADATPNPADVKSVTYNPGTNVGQVVVGGQGQGALGNGSYDVLVQYCVQCPDRTGDVLSRNCISQISFTFQPADGPCSAASNVGSAVFEGTSCSAPQCALCPTPTGP